MTRANNKNILIVDNTLTGKIVDTVTRTDGAVIYFDEAEDKYKHTSIDPSTSAYAELHIHDSVTSQSIPTGATYTKSTAFVDAGISVNCTADVANDKIIITNAGKYRIEGSFSFTTDTNNTVLFGTVFLGGVELNNIHFERKISTGADIGNSGFTGLVNVNTVPADLDVRVRHDNVGSVAVLFKYANLNVNMIGL